MFRQHIADRTCHELRFVMDGTPFEGADPQKDYVSSHNVTFVKII